MPASPRHPEALDDRSRPRSDAPAPGLLERPAMKPVLKRGARPGDRDHRRHQRDRARHRLCRRGPGRPAGAGRAQPPRARCGMRDDPRQGRQGDPGGRRRLGSCGAGGRGVGGDPDLRRLRHLGEQRRHRHLRQAGGGVGSRPPPPVRRELLGPGLRQPDRHRASEAEGRRADQPRQRPLRRVVPAPGATAPARPPSAAIPTRCGWSCSTMAHPSPSR